jgi:hypothetical protein
VSSEKPTSAISSSSAATPSSRVLAVRLPAPVKSRASMASSIASMAGYAVLITRSSSESETSAATGCSTNTQNTRPSPAATIAASTSPARSRSRRPRSSSRKPTTSIGYALR